MNKFILEFLVCLFKCNTFEYSNLDVFIQINSRLFDSNIHMRIEIQNFKIAFVKTE